MWKPKTSATGESEVPVSQEPQRAVANPPVAEPSPQRPSAPDQSTIGKGVVIKGDITGGDSLFIDGRVEGAIQIPGEKVTVGKNGTVVGRSGATCITAREIVVHGNVTGNIAASERVDIRAGASLTGDLTTVRVSIEDGAYFRGGIDIRREDPKTISAAARFETVQPV